MLRTHGELGYRQEQRFHLELGLLKMAHAQRLLPLEQLLSEAGAGGMNAARPVAKPAAVPEIRRTKAARATVSPFAADSARKAKPEMTAEDDSGAGPRSAVAGVSAAPVMMGAAAPAMAETAPEISGRPELAIDINSLRDSVLNAIAGHRMLAAMLE